MIITRIYTVNCSCSSREIRFLRCKLANISSRVLIRFFARRTCCCKPAIFCCCCLVRLRNIRRAACVRGVVRIISGVFTSLGKAQNSLLCLLGALPPVLSEFQASRYLSQPPTSQLHTSPLMKHVLLLPSLNRKNSYSVRIT